MVRTIPIAHVKISGRGERDIGRHEIDRMLRIGRILAWIAMSPERLAAHSRLHDLAAIDVAMVENFAALLVTQAKSVRSAAEFLAEGANEFPRRVVNDSRL